MHINKIILLSCLLIAGIGKDADAGTDRPQKKLQPQKVRRKKYNEQINFVFKSAAKKKVGRRSGYFAPGEIWHNVTQEQKSKYGQKEVPHQQKLVFSLVTSEEIAEQERAANRWQGELRAEELNQHAKVNVQVTQSNGQDGSPTTIQVNMQLTARVAPSQPQQSAFRPHLNPDEAYEFIFGNRVQK